MRKPSFLLLVFLIVVLGLSFSTSISVNGQPESVGTVGTGVASKVPVTDHTIDPHMVFDGANYIYVTNYGNYTWLQPLNILRYENLTGDTLIDQSVFLVQHNTTGTWLPLIDLDNVLVEASNDSHYILSYDLMYRYRGTNYVVANTTLTFDLVHAGALPKIGLVLTQTANWTDLELDSFRWLWDVVPDQKYEYWVNEGNETTTQLPSNDVVDLGVNYRGYLGSESEYSLIKNFLKIDCSDMAFPSKFEGGKEPYWNSRGIVVTFLVNQATIDPSTVDTSSVADATKIEQQRNVFKNPRGQNYYYACMANDTNVDNDYRWFWYGTQDGSSWARYDEAGEQMIVDVAVAGDVGGVDFWIIEDASNSRLLIYCVHSDYDGNDVRLYCYNISDSETELDKLWQDISIASTSQDAVRNPSICIAEDGYVWVTYTDEWTNKGKQRNQLCVVCSTTTAPHSTAPGWTSVTAFYGDAGDGLRCNAGPYIRSEVVPLSATADVAIVFSYYEVGVTQALMGMTSSYAGGSAPSEDSEVTLDSAIHSWLHHSSVVETETNSDVFIYYRDTDGLDLIEWDVSGESGAPYGTVSSDAVNALSMSLAIDTNANPDKLYCFRTNTTQGYVYYDTTEVDSFSLEGEQTIDDSAIGETNNDISSSYCDWTSDGELQLVWTTQTSHYVRFWRSLVGQVEYCYGVVNQSITIEHETAWDFLVPSTVNQLFTITSYRTFSFTLLSTTNLLFTISSSVQTTIMKYFYGVINSVFAVSRQLGWSFYILDAINQAFTLVTTKSLVYPMLTTINQLFSVDTSRAFVQSICKTISSIFSINRQLVWSFDLLKAINQVFTLESFTNIYQNIINVYGVIAQVVAVATQLGWVFGLTSTVNAIFGIVSTVESTVMKYFYGTINQLFQVASQKLVSFNVLDAINQAFALTSTLSWTHNILSTIAQLLTIESVVGVSQQVLNFYGVIGQVFSVATTKAWTFLLSSTVNPLFTLASSVYSTVLKYVSGVIAQTLSITTQTATSLLIDSTLGLVWTIQSSVLLPGLLNIYGAIRVVFVTLWHSDLPLEATIRTLLWFAFAFTIGVAVAFTVALKVKRQSK